MRSRINCLSSLDSGKRPVSFLEKMTEPFNRTSKIPPEPGTSARLVIYVLKVVSSSCAIQEARSNQ
jgi:hypothetical protein